MSDSQNPDASAPEDLILEGDAAATDSSTNEVENPEPSYDLSSLRSEFEQIRSTAATRSELEGLKRQAGHVPALQREIAELKAELAKAQTLGERLDAYEMMLLDALPVDKAEEIERVRNQREIERMVEERVAPFREKLEKETPPEPEDVEPDYTVILQAQAEAATRTVKTYANEKGIDPESIPSEVWVDAQKKHGLDFEAATVDVLKWVDAKAQEGTPAERRAERRAAASGGNPSERHGSAGRYDLNTLSGLAKARREGAIDSDEFLKGYNRITKGL